MGVSPENQSLQCAGRGAYEKIESVETETKAQRKQQPVNGRRIIDRLRKFARIPSRHYEGNRTHVLSLRVLDHRRSTDLWRPLAPLSVINRDAQQNSATKITGESGLEL
jgi:hypothetical protein